jgi:L-ascorbate metabolism protein UlaG (beta-lactamase superfamily)
MGDTGLFGDMKLIGEYYKPDLPQVPIGGHYVMDPKDAAYATKELIKPKMAMPNTRRRWARLRSRSST